jgi:DNA replication licensing factor MCM5
VRIPERLPGLSADPLFDSSDVTGANHCGLDPWVIVHDKCKFLDSQSIKLQEAPDMVPVGELPRHMILQAERYLTGQVVPGSRMIATGIYSTFAPSGKNVSAFGPQRVVIF